MLRIISFIRQQTVRGDDSIHDWLGHRNIGDIAWRQGDGDRSAAMIDQCVYFAGPAAARPPDRLRFFPLFPPEAERCALTWVLSRLSSSGIGPAAANVLNNRCHMPR